MAAQRNSSCQHLLFDSVECLWEKKLLKWGSIFYSVFPKGYLSSSSHLRTESTSHTATDLRPVGMCNMSQDHSLLLSFLICCGSGLTIRALCRTAGPKWSLFFYCSFFLGLLTPTFLATPEMMVCQSGWNMTHWFLVFCSPSPFLTRLLIIANTWRFNTRLTTHFVMLFSALY